MTDTTSVTVTPQHAPPARAPKDTLPARVTGKVRHAIELMVWHALPRDQAAEKAGLKGNGLYKALRKPAVKAHYLSELEVLRTSERARNIHRLVAIRDAADNMPAVQAIDRLERLDEQRAAAAQQQMPGFVIVVQNGPSHTAHVQSTEAKPLIEHELGRDADGERDT